MRIVLQIFVPANVNIRIQILLFVLTNVVGEKRDQLNLYVQARDSIVGIHICTLQILFFCSAKYVILFSPGAHRH